MTRERTAEELRSWLEKYEPVEREILEARARQLDNAARRRQSRARRFGDLCEATEGLAVRWRRKGTPVANQFKWADGDVWTMTCLLNYHRREASRRVDGIMHALRRPLYYAAENERRRQAAAERRRIRRRTTENPCPSREDILDAWVHRRDSHAATIRFGGLIEDLECYLDNSLRFNEGGAIVGRNGGIKRWLQEEIPALFLRYSTVMRYKAAAHKLRQIVEVTDPISAVSIVAEECGVGESNDGNAHTEPGATVVASENHELKLVKWMAVSGEPKGESPKSSTETMAGAAEPMMESRMSLVRTLRPQKVTRPLTVVRARAIWHEVTEGVADNPTALFARLDALLDPERVEEANMLASWRRRYNNEIMVRTKDSWWRRLTRKGISGRRKVSSE